MLEDHINCNLFWPKKIWVQLPKTPIRISLYFFSWQVGSPADISVYLKFKGWHNMIHVIIYTVFLLIESVLFVCLFVCCFFLFCFFCTSVRNSKGNAFLAVIRKPLYTACWYLVRWLTGVRWPSWRNIEVKGQGQGHEGHETPKTLKLQYLPHFFS